MMILEGELSSYFRQKCHNTLDQTTFSCVVQMIYIGHFRGFEKEQRVIAQFRSRQRCSHAFSYSQVAPSRPRIYHQETLSYLHSPESPCLVYSKRKEELYSKD